MFQALSWNYKKKKNLFSRLNFTVNTNINNGCYSWMLIVEHSNLKDCLYLKVYAPYSVFGELFFCSLSVLVFRSKTTILIKFSTLDLILFLSYILRKCTLTFYGDAFIVFLFEMCLKIFNTRTVFQWNISPVGGLEVSILEYKRSAVYMCGRTLLCLNWIVKGTVHCTIVLVLLKLSFSIVKRCITVCCLWYLFLETMIFKNWIKRHYVYVTY